MNDYTPSKDRRIEVSNNRFLRLFLSYSTVSKVLVNVLGLGSGGPKHQERERSCIYRKGIVGVRLTDGLSKGGHFSVFNRLYSGPTVHR